MSHELVDDLQKKAISVSQACRVLDVSRSGYYAAAKRSQAAQRWRRVAFSAWLQRKRGAPNHGAGCWHFGWRW